MPRLEQAIAELPDTADEIAQMLIEADCQGSQRDGRRCPMANYLIRLGFTEPFVQPDYVQAGVDSPPCISAALGEFVERFDDGEWPELINGPEEDDG